MIRQERTRRVKIREFTSSLKILGTLQDTGADTLPLAHPSRSEGVLFPRLRVENKQKMSSLSVFIESIKIVIISFSRSHLLQLAYYLGIFFTLLEKRKKERKDKEN